MTEAARGFIGEHFMQHIETVLLLKLCFHVLNVHTEHYLYVTTVIFLEKREGVCMSPIAATAFLNIAALIIPKNRNY